MVRRVIRRLRAALRPPVVQVVCPASNEAVAAVRTLEDDVRSLRGDVAALHHRLEDADLSLRFMVGEVSKMAQQLVPLALGTHHDASVAARSTTSLLDDVRATLDDCVRVIVAEREAVTAAHDATDRRLHELSEAVTRAVVEIVRTGDAARHDGNRELAAS